MKADLKIFFKIGAVIHVQIFDRCSNALFFAHLAPYKQPFLNGKKVPQEVTSCVILTYNVSRNMNRRVYMTNTNKRQRFWLYLTNGMRARKFCLVYTNLYFFTLL